ncbi:MAG TPA: hypothetical protein VFQ47_00540, partial [Nitrososphaera sp.]|nr:hypothetical protein [Nitrososphaera sp.]
EWAALIAELWSNPRRLARLSQKARGTVRERFTMEHVANQISNLFDGVAADVTSGGYERPPSLNWGENRSPTGDVLPPPSLFRSVVKVRGLH